MSADRRTPARSRAGSCDRRTPVRSHAASRARGAARGEAGFTLIEVMVSMVVIGTVMAALTVFFTNSLTFTGHKRSEQLAIQLAGDAVERARAVKGSALLAGRSDIKSKEQWDDAPTAVLPYLQTMKRDWDPMLASGSTSGDTATLPTKPVTVTVGGVRYEQSWYVGRCRQPGPSSSVTALACDHPDKPIPGTVSVPFFRVVVAVTWNHKACQPEECVYVTSTLMSSAGDPIFYIKRPPPVVTNPGPQYGYRTVAVNLQLLASGGRLPLTWSVTGLPAGLTGSTSGQVTGTPTTPGTYTVKAAVTDRDGDTDTAEFPWTIYDLPELTNPGDQTTRAGTPVSLQIQATGGRGPLAWSAAGLPAGLSVNTTTGVVSGTPTTYETRQVTVTITDKGGKTDSVTFAWEILTLDMAEAGPRTNYIRDYVSGVRMSATGGAGPYIWRAENLPDGLRIDPATGEIYGTTWWGTRYVTTVYVKDRTGDEVATTFVWNVRQRRPNDMGVVAPDPAAPDQAGTAGRPVSLAVVADGGSNSGYNTWTADGLPPGLRIAPDGPFNGEITGTPTTPGTYTVRLKVVDSTNKWAVLMFTWTVR
ncbi:putative Ig domain-containing protein [Planomonospora sp. ID67723]|uniref:putative Ig domain-containing protein n=1 Tax=Planomonospora sp. ID67723 TaxID=2738134 RepID=UPI0018C364CF|nr:putative Ig domain-containing protein [Planomonospora sp. ID67723]MBG0830667.1 putative Ig domain-containing protein [Planomonospora sp. ID67723]